MIRQVGIIWAKGNSPIRALDHLMNCARRGISKGEGRNAADDSAHHSITSRTSTIPLTVLRGEQLGFESLHGVTLQRVRRLLADVPDVLAHREVARVVA